MVYGGGCGAISLSVCRAAESLAYGPGCGVRSVHGAGLGWWRGGGSGIGYKGFDLRLLAFNLSGENCQVWCSEQGKLSLFPSFVSGWF